MIYRRWIIMGILSMFFGCRQSGPYQFKDGQWYYRDLLIEAADAKSFEPLNAFFARDRHTGFFKNKQIGESKGLYFKALNEHYAKDDEHVFYAEVYRKGQEYFSIKHDRIVILDADPLKVRVINDDFIADDKHVFFKGKVFPSNDPENFQVLDYGYAKDSRQVYFDTQVLPEPDASNLVILDLHYIKDNKQVFYLEMDYSSGKMKSILIKDADAASFTTETSGNDSGDAKDQHHSYLQGKRLK